MTIKTRASQIVLAAVVLILPAVLIVHALLTSRELGEMKRAYLRSRAAAVAGRLETLPAGTADDARLDALSQEEPALAGVQIFSRGDSGAEAATLESIWNGQVLYRTTETTVAGEPVFRAYVPFHAQDGLRIARIDLLASASDFLVTHAKNNLTLLLFVAAVLWALALYALWAARRVATLERKQLELAHLAQIGRLSAVLAHEIRNPLGTIKGFVQLAAERSAPDVKGLLEPLVQEVLRLERLVTDLLAYGRPRQPERKSIRWQGLAGEVRALTDHTGATVSFGTEDWTLETDPELLKQVLLNLIRNALEAVEGGDSPLVTVSSAMHRGTFAITIADNGRGLPDEVRAKLFEPFVSTKATGTGLGLPIARKLTEALGGTLRLSGNVPHGTVAELAFPRMNAQPVVD